MKAFFKTGNEQSMTRLVFFTTSLMVLIWETYAVFNRSTVPHITEILLFAGGMLANKQVQERLAEKGKPDAPAVPPVP